MEVLCRVVRPFYDWDGRKYLELESRDMGLHFRVKVPFRYGRVMCKADGLRTIQEIKQDEIIIAFMEKKVWDGDVHWILHGFREVTPE
jgi:hypothetical protein